MSHWLDALTPRARALVLAACPRDESLETWATKKRPELGGISVCQALDPESPIPHSLSWLLQLASANAAQPAVPPADRRVGTG